VEELLFSKSLQDQFKLLGPVIEKSLSLPFHYKMQKGVGSNIR